MSFSTIVLIGSADVLPALRERLGLLDGELLTFTHTDAVAALDTITERRPSTVALERLFAATPRGAALINRIKADPLLAACEVRVIAADSDYSRIAKPATEMPVGVPPTTQPFTPAQPAVVDGGPSTVRTGPPPSVRPLDTQGTRRAARVRMATALSVVIDGNEARLIDLSTLGAQVISSAVLKPKQRVRLSFADDTSATRVNAVVAWAVFEMAAGRAQYRAGLEFSDAERGSLEALCARHGA